MSTEEAKTRFLEAASQVGVRAWVKRRPYEALTISFVAGLALATSQPLRRAVVRMVIRSL